MMNPGGGMGIAADVDTSKYDFDLNGAWIEFVIAS